MASALLGHRSTRRPPISTLEPHPTVTCGPSVSTGHGACVSLAQQCLMQVRAGIHCWCRLTLRWLSVTAQHAIGSATPHSSHPCTSGWRRRWPWTVPLTHPHCNSLLLRLPGRLSAPRADFFPADPLPLCGVGTSSNAFSHASLVRTILHNDTGAYR